MLLELWSAARVDHVYPSEGFSFNIVNGVKRVNGSDRSRSRSTFQYPPLAVPFVLERWGVNVQWFQDNSSQALPNSKEVRVRMTCGLSVGLRNFRKLDSVSWEVFLFCTDKIESIEWQDLVPRLRIGACFEIHILHKEMCDLLLSSHQTSLLEALDCQCVFCKKPL